MRFYWLSKWLTCADIFHLSTVCLHYFSQVNILPRLSSQPPHSPSLFQPWHQQHYCHWSAQIVVLHVDFPPSFSVPLPLRSFLSPYSCSPRQHSPIAPYKTSLIDRTVSWRNFWSLLPQLSSDGMSGLFLYHWKVDGKFLLLTLLKLFVVHQFFCF